MEQRKAPSRVRRRYNNRFNNSWDVAGFDSKFEARIGEQLNEAGVTYKHQPPPIKYIRESEYTPDFLITTKSGKQIYIEAKGYWLPSDRSKHKLVCLQNPDKDIRLVFQNANNRINKGSNTTYADWCKRFKVKWAHLDVPKEWFEE